MVFGRQARQRVSIGMALLAADDLERIAARCRKITDQPTHFGARQLVFKRMCQYRLATSSMYPSNNLVNIRPLIFYVGGFPRSQKFLKGILRLPYRSYIHKVPCKMWAPHQRIPCKPLRAFKRTYKTQFCQSLSDGLGTTEA